MKNKLLICILGLCVAGVASADLLYGISSFNNDGTIASDANWHAGITTIAVGFGLTGTTDAELRTFAIAGGLDPDTYGGIRFRNVESHNAAYETVTVDPGGYFQFGATDGGLGTMTATNLSFQSRAATGSDDVGRGYSIEVSIDGGAYSALASDTVVNGRNNGLMDSISIPLTGATYENISSIDFRVSSTVGGVEFTNFAVTGTIPPPPTEPPYFPVDPVVKTNGLYGSDYALQSQTLAGSAIDPDGDPLSYTNSSGGWLVVASDGALSGVPDVTGTNTFTVQAFDGLLGTTAELEIFIEALGSPPVFTTNFMVRADGVKDEDYALQSQTLAGSATDLDGDTLSYTNSSGGWLVVASDGALSGIADTYGTNTFTVVVDDGNTNTDTATLQIFVPAPVGGTVFQGGDLSLVGNWNNGAPIVGNPGTINVSGTTPAGTGWGQTFGYGTGAAPAPGVAITIGSDAVLTFDNDATAFNCDVTVNNATLNCGDDYYASDNGHHIFNAGSVVNADRIETQGANATITINGGTHTAETGFGTQGKSGSGVSFLGGTAIAGTEFSLGGSSSNTVSGSAVLTGAGIDASGVINILNDWTGSWAISTFVAGDWETLVTNTANGFTLDGVAIDAAIFADRFTVSTDGTTLILGADVQPVTVTIAGPVAGNLELTWDGNIGVTYSVETNANLIISQGWNTWMSTNATETGSITVTAPVTVTEDQIFYRVQAQ